MKASGIGRACGWVFILASLVGSSGVIADNGKSRRVPQKTGAHATDAAADGTGVNKINSGATLVNNENIEESKRNKNKQDIRPDSTNPTDQKVQTIAQQAAADKQEEKVGKALDKALNKNVIATTPGGSGDGSPAQPQR